MNDIVWMLQRTFFKFLKSKYFDFKMITYTDI